MRPLDLSAAAEFLGLHPHTLQERARAGVIPGAKVGKAWRFLDVDLAAYLRANYPANKPEEAPCRSTRSAGRGTSTSSTADAELESLLGLPIRGRRSDSTTNSRRRSGQNPVRLVTS
jgi:excisionase family DNA binding protein